MDREPRPADAPGLRDPGDHRASRGRSAPRQQRLRQHGRRPAPARGDRLRGDPRRGAAPALADIVDGLVLPAASQRPSHPELRRLPDRPAQGRDARGRCRDLPGRLPGARSRREGDVPVRGRGAGSAIRRDSDAVGVPPLLRRTGRAAREGRANCSSRATATSSTSRSTRPTSSPTRRPIGRGPGRCSPTSAGS